MKQNETEKVPKSSTDLSCQFCNTLFHSRVTLWRHKKTCINILKQIASTIDINQNNYQDNELITCLLKENTEFKQLMIEQNKQLIELSKKVGSNNNNNNNNNTNNNNCETKENDHYLQIVSQSMSASNEEETVTNHEKIIRNISKEVFIDK